MKMRRCLFYFILLGLLCAITPLSESAPGGTCEVGDIIQPGESCTDPGTGDDFSVLGNGAGRYLFITAGAGILNLQGNINGKQRNFTAKKRADGNWEILSVTAPPQTAPDVLVVDPDSPPIYWTDVSTDKIQRVALNGSNIEDLVTHGLSIPCGLALDVAGGKMYWTDLRMKKIQRANLDGSNVENLVTHGLSSPRGIALDVVGGKMYWVDAGTDKIQRADLDGSNVEDLVTHGLRSPRAIALDVVRGKMYWIDIAAAKIQRANLDGSNVEDLITRGLDAPFYIALDVVRGKMYWTHRDFNAATLTFTNGKIQRANLDGTEVQDIIIGLGRPDGIALGIPSQTAPSTPDADVNGDGIVNIQDLVLVASNLGKTGQNATDVNGDGQVNIQDLVLVAGALGTTATAPSAHLQSLDMLRSADVKQWLLQAQHLNLTDATSQRGILFLQQLLEALIPKETELLPNYPNPFNPETWIPYQLAQDADVTLTIYAMNGDMVRRLALGHQSAGVYQTRSRAAYWDGRNALGERVASGLYLYTLTAGDFSATRKMLIRK